MGITKSKRTDPFEQYTKQIGESKRLAAIGSVMLVAAAIVMAAGFLVPTIKKKLPKLSNIPKLRSSKMNRTPDLSTPASPDFVAPSVSVKDKTDARFMEDAEILQGRSHEEAPPAPPTHNKTMLKAMFGKR